MKINSTSQYEGQEYQMEYSDADSFSSLPLQLCKQIYGICFIGDKILIVKNGKKNTWGPPGGTIESGETVDQACRREIQEETNSEVTASLPIGYQKVTRPDGSFTYQLRNCCLIERSGEFTNDPGGDVSEVKLIDPKDYKEYFNWGDIGERIIERAIELKSKL